MSRGAVDILKNHELNEGIFRYYRAFSAVIVNKQVCFFPVQMGSLFCDTGRLNFKAFA